MALRLDQAIIRGELSNEIRGTVTGHIWLLGADAPVQLTLEGNCLRDLAGCTIRFSNPKPVADETTELIAPVQKGATGDMTASRKARVASVSDEELFELMDKGMRIPSVLANILYLEWFSEANGRVVVEARDFDIAISAPAWQMSAEEEESQIQDARQEFHSFLNAITGDLEDDEEFPESEEEEEDDDDFSNEVIEEGEEGEDGTPLDEFQWEQALRDQDRRAEAYQEAVDRYKDHPAAERLIAEAMGCDLENLADWVSSNEDEDPGVLLMDEVLNDGEGEAEHHPLSRKATNFAISLQREAGERGLLEPHSESCVVGVVVNIITLSCKLAAALDPLQEGYDCEPGFIIAMLKRAQTPLNEALHGISSLSRMKMPAATRQWLRSVQQELFSLRGEILDIMKEMRSRQE